MSTSYLNKLSYFVINYTITIKFRQVNAYIIKSVSIFNLICIIWKIIRSVLFMTVASLRPGIVFWAQS
ncbi:unnamed protein product [Blepharisma stoltei]|uniref:Uncharacterized protein n=1 Tax=Blepharisma stoltei TaxID=1481888 RepID=A0AAU9J3I6_9CILI|nr:unnamed protein product [Blepharisma stoltei]